MSRLTDFAWLLAITGLGWLLTSRSFWRRG